MNRFLVLTVLVMSGLLTACEKGDTDDATLEKAGDIASEAADATKKATGEAIEYTGDKMQQAGESVSETGESMQTPE
jgi:major membrane immunogen (membrane-anchored lipoprotein)